MSRAMLTVLACLAGLLVAPAALAAGPTYAVRAAKIYTAADRAAGPIENGVILIEDGAITGVLRSDRPTPTGMHVLDLGDATVIPGLVAAHTRLAGGVNTPRSVSAAYRAADALDRFADNRRLLAHGVTTVHLNPGEGRFVSGVSGVAKLAGPPTERLLLAEADVAVNFVDAAENPPKLVEAPVPPSADNMIDPGRYQRPRSSMEYRLALREALDAAFMDDRDRDRYDHHLVTLREAWERGAPVRVRADRGPAMAAADAMLRDEQREGYVVGGAELGEITGPGPRVFDVQRTGLVYLIDAAFGRPGPNVGGDPERLSSSLDDLIGPRARGGRLALAPRSGAIGEYRLAAALAQRGGLDASAALAGVTRIPAELLGVGHRVGSIEPGKDADLVVLSGDPLATSSHVLRVFVGGRQVFDAGRAGDRLVVRAGEIWLGPNERLRGGQVLIEDGVITAVGASTPHPPGARLIEAPGAFVTPGFIDGFGHLGFAGDRGALGADVKLSRLVGAADDASRLVAHAGVTTVLTAPYRLSSSGSQMAAIKTAGGGRDDRVVAETAGVAFDVRGLKPEDVAGRFKGRLEAGKAYLEKWRKYEEELEAWRKARAAGKQVKTTKEDVVEEAGEEGEADPITGTWMMKLSSEVLPPPGSIEGRVALTLTGTEIEGRVIEPEAQQVEHKITGTLDGTSITGVIEIDTGGQGFPAWEAELDAEDSMTGTLSFQGISADLSGNRIDRKAVEFKVARKRRQTGKDGRPLAPPVDDALEPFRLALEKKIPIVVLASSPAEIAKTLDALVGEWELSVVFVGGDGAKVLKDRVASEAAGVVAPPRIIRREDERDYHQADDLSRAGIDVAFQSAAEDAARTLPTVALYAVERGMGGEAALDALTGAPARMYGLGDRLGAIKPGAEGDLVIWTGHPFDPASRVERVIIGGKEIR